jgi:methylornithine synthase
MNRNRLNHILDNATNGFPPSHEEIAQLLSLSEPDSIQRVMAAARKVREQFFGKWIFLYGFIYFSTYCRNHCTFCFYRRTNEESPRYRKSPEEVVESAQNLARAGVHLIDLTMGEDPLIHRTGNFEILIQVTKAVKEETGLSVMVSPGVVPDETLWDLATSGADWYALYQETHNPVLFEELRTGQCFEERSSKRLAASSAGLLLEDGILLGAGETPLDRADSVAVMQESPIHQARVMSFIPQPQTPLAARQRTPILLECLCIAVMRLAMPDRLIPASLDVDGIKGLKVRLESGANVVTSIIPPRNSLAGVSRCALDIEEGLRSVPEVKKILTSLNLHAASAQDYEAWMDTQIGKEADRENCQPTMPCAKGCFNECQRADLGCP